MEQELLPTLMENLDAGKELTLTTQEIRDVIAKAEEKMMGSNLKIEIPIEHYFSKAVYGREMRVPKGTLLTGKIHKFQNLNILSKGEATVLSIDGVMRIKAPYTFVASPGTKRLIYAHEDTVWTTILGSDEKDPEKIEEQFIAKNYEELNYLDNTHVEKLEE